MIAVELAKLLRRRRTWTSIGLLCALPAVVAAFLATTEISPPPGQGAAFLSAVLQAGTLYPAAALAMVLPVFLPIAVVLVGGDSVAGEASTGTLRYLLIRPVGRTTLLVAKLVALAAFVALAVVLVAGSSLLVGIALFGVGDAATVLAPLPPAFDGPAPAPPAGPDGAAPPGSVTSLSGTTLTPQQLTLRLLGAMGYVTLSMLGVGAIALFLSTVTDSALGAALGALAALVSSQVLVTLDAAASVSPYLPTRYWLSWVDFFREPLFLYDVQRGLVLQACYVLVFFAAAWANFATKDVTS